jgi:protein involved in polysaccharide export with SLBB domain
VQKHPEYSVSAVTVPLDGKINYPLAGSIQAEGKTVDELTQIIVEALRRELRNPEVIINIAKSMSRYIYVWGAVRKPGPVDLDAINAESLSVAAAIGLAGGYSYDADDSYVMVLRQGQEPERVPLKTQRPLIDIPTEATTTLFAGDTLIVPQVVAWVSIMGEVNSPGRFPLRPMDSFLSFVAQAEGLTAKADRKKALLMRAGGSQMEIDITGISEGKLDTSKLPSLMDGDIIVFLPARNDVVVLGEVNKPGTIELLPNMTVLDALGAAGGQTKDADLRHVEVVDREGNKREVALADVDGKLKLDMDDPEQARLFGGETIRIPKLEHLVSVLGYVQKPGPVDFEPGDRIADVVSRAGGLMVGKARPEQTVLVRHGPRPEQVEVLECNLSKVLRGEETSTNVAVRHGDMIYVPGVADPLTRSDLLRSVLQLGSVLAIWGR